LKLFYFTLLLNASLIVYFVVSNKKSKFDVLDPGLGFVILLFCYGFLSYFFNISTRLIDFNVEVRYAIAITVGLLGFIGGYKLKPTKGHGTDIVDLRRLHSKNIIITIVLVALALNLVDPTHIIQLLKFDPLSYTEVAFRAERTSVSGPYAFMSEISLHFIFFMFLVRGYENKKTPYFGFAIILLFAIYYFKGGSKGILIYALLMFLIYYNYRISRLDWKPVSVLFVTLLLIFSVYSHVRYVSDIGSMIELGVQLVGEMPEVLLPVSFGEFTGPPGTLFDIIEGSESGFKHLSYGITWLNEIQVFIPQFLYPDRPLPGSELYMKLFKPNALDGIGDGWFIINDGYWAFGQVGVFVILFAYGLLLKRIYNYFIKNNYKSFVLLTYPYVYFILVITSVRTGFFGSIKVLLMYTTIMYIVSSLARIRFNGTRYF
jgi:oligosaccharide repeat unit polymerase